MNRTLKILLFLLLLHITTAEVYCQSNYPIFVTPTLTPPYSLKLSDYSRFGSQQLMVTLVVNDLNITDLPVKLRIKMETAGVTIENPVTLNTTPIYLGGGSTTVLFGSDLDDYFNINNLIFKGYSKETYQRTGQLPEGFYRFTVEVLHYQTNRVISNQGTTTAWIALGKPPMLKTPADGAEAGQYRGMPITFSWINNSVGSPLSAGSIQYRFEMWEMRIPGIAANTVAASVPVFHEYTTFNTTYTLYTDALMMEPGMRYAWRVKAFDESGFTPFEQDGHSGIWTFVYKTPCDSVTNLTSITRGTNGQFNWDVDDNHSSFNVEMRNPVSGWSTQNITYENKAEFFDLAPGSTYELRVQAVCNGDADNKSGFSHWERLTIPPPRTLTDTNQCPTCVCSDDIPPGVLTNFTLRDDLKNGDTIINKFGTTRFILKNIVRLDNGTYKGIFLFWAEIWNLKIICEFWDLQVNTDNVIVNMDFESVYNPQFLLDVDATRAYLENLAGAVTELTTDYTPDDTMTVIGTITNIYINGGDSVIAVITGENGEVFEQVLSDNPGFLSETMVMGTDSTGYVVTRDGDVMGAEEFAETGGNSNALEEMNNRREEEQVAASATVDFTASTNQKYGFDKYTEIKYNLQTQYPTLNNGYKVPFKSVASFRTDPVGFTSASGSNVIFKDEMGIPVIKSGSELTIRGMAGGSETALYAWQPTSDTTEEIVGKLNVMSFDEQFMDLQIVSVNGATTPIPLELQTTLNKIYAQAVTSWIVAQAQSITGVEFANERMTHGGSSAIATYNADQKAIINAYENQYGKLDDNTIYLFYVENVDDKERSIGGYMPLQRQVGFIYDKPNLNISAHELGHGAFNLWHSFSTDNSALYIAAEGETSNLMDYTIGASELWQHQWGQVQNPDNIMLAFLQDEEEGEMTAVGFEFFSQFANAVDKSVSFFTPAGTIITLPANTTRIYFSTFDKCYNTDTHYGAPMGAVLAFDIENQNETMSYVGIGSKTDDGYQFYAYIKQEDALNINNIPIEQRNYYIDELTKKYSPTKAVALFTTVEAGNFVGYASEFEVFETKSNPTLNQYSISENPEVFKELFVGGFTNEDYELTVGEYFNTKAKGSILKLEYNELSHFINAFADIQIYSSPLIKANDYLLTVISQDSKIIDVLTQFAIIYQSPDAFKAFYDCIKMNSANEQERLMHVYNSIQFKTEYLELSQKINSLKSTQKWESEFIPRLVSYNQASSAELFASKIFSASSIEDIYKATEEFYSPCTFRALNSEARIKLMDWLLKSDNDYWEISGINLIKTIIENTPEGEPTIDLLNSFIKYNNDNYLWVRNLWKEADNKQAFEVAEILSGLIRLYWQKLDIEVTYYTDSYQFITFESPISNKTLYYGLSQEDKYCEPFIDINTHQIVPICNIYVSRGSYDSELKVDIQENGKIHFYQEYSKYRKVDATVSQNSVTNADEYLGSYNMEFEANPFEYVSVYFTNDYPDFGIKSSQLYFVPAIWVLSINKQIEIEQLKDYSVSVGIDIFNIALTACTWGTSTGFAAVLDGLNVAISTCNIISSTADIANGNDLYIGEWNEFYNTFQYAQLSYSAFGVVKSGVLNDAWKSFDNLISQNAQKAQTEAVDVFEAWQKCNNIKNGVNFSEGLATAGDVWKLSLQKLGKPASGTTLGENLIAFGKTKPTNSHAHHITAGGASNIDAINTRAILQREGIDINEAANGVFLPSSSKYAIDDGIPHANVHTNLYYRTVFERLNAVPAGKVRDELQKIADELLNGTFPY